MYDGRSFHTPMHVRLLIFVPWAHCLATSPSIAPGRVRRKSKVKNRIQITPNTSIPSRSGLESPGNKFIELPRRLKPMDGWIKLKYLLFGCCFASRIIQSILYPSENGFFVILISSVIGVIYTYVYMLGL